MTNGDAAREGFTVSGFWTGDQFVDSVLLAGLAVAFIGGPLWLLGAVMEARRYRQWKRDREQGKGHHAYVHPDGRIEARWTTEELQRMMDRFDCAGRWGDDLQA